MKAFFEHIERSGFIQQGKPNDTNIDHAPFSKIIKCAEESTELTSSKHFEKEKSLFAYSASLSLGGGNHPCASLNCRFRHINELSQFAALYADRVYIKNLLSDFLLHCKLRSTSEESDLKRRFFEHLIVLSHLRPLIEKGIIIPFTPSDNYCPHCLAKISFGKDADKRFEKEYKRLCKKYLDEVQALFGRDGHLYFFDYKSSDLLLEHGTSYTASTAPPKELLQRSRIMSQVHSGKVIKLSKELRRLLKIHKQFAQIIFQNIIFELSTSQALATSFLTERELHVQILNSLSGDSSLEQRNYLAERYLKSIVPILGGIDLEKVLKIRKQEEDAFILYRHALHNAIGEYRNQKKGFTERDAKAIYGDIIQPELAKLDRKVKTAERSFRRDTGIKALSWTGAISFGLYAGFIPPELIAAASALGFTNIVADLLESAMNKSDREKSIRDEQMYFLWKVRETSK